MNIWRISAFGGHAVTHGQYLFSFATFTFGVSPISPGHQCGIVYTLDRWATTCRASAQWTGNDPFGNETWHIYFQMGDGSGANFPTLRLWYAAFVRDAQGNEAWDNNGGLNHELIIGDTAQGQTLLRCTNYP